MVHLTTKNYATGSMRPFGMAVSPVGIRIIWVYRVNWRPELLSELSFLPAVGMINTSTFNDVKAERKLVIMNW